MPLVTLSADSPLQEILDIMKRDGGIIIKDFANPELLKELNTGFDPLVEGVETPAERDALDKELGEGFSAPNTIRIYGLLGKMPGPISKVIMHPVWDGIMSAFLSDSVTHYVGGNKFTQNTTYQLNLCMAFQIMPGAPDQALHKDQMIHSVRPGTGIESNSIYTSVLGCMVAGTRSTAKNGGKFPVFHQAIFEKLTFSCAATKVIPGSHLWPQERGPTPEEAVSAEMEPGSALFWLGSLYHGGGANICTPEDADNYRRLYGVFACRDYYRQEENQFLATPTEVVKTLSPEILKRSGWTKAKGGAGFLEAKHPAEVLGYCAVEA